ncbi:MAG TPA: DUF983 domain-containing protein [Gemmatimonadales bacterium]
MSATPPTHHAPELDLRRALRLLGRAALLRCPNCGGRSIFSSFLQLRPDCPTCGLQLDRGEDDYFLGAYLFNLVAVELLFAGLMAAVVVMTWPDPPWALIQYGGAALMVAGAVLCYPFAKVGWLAFDLMLRPVDPDELPGPLPPEVTGEQARPRGRRR